MSHRFSNRSTVRAAILANVQTWRSWQDLPQPTRVDLIIFLEDVVKEVLREVR